MQIQMDIKSWSSHRSSGDRDRDSRREGAGGAGRLPGQMNEDRAMTTKHSATAAAATTIRTGTVPVPLLSPCTSPPLRPPSWHISALFYFFWPVRWPIRALPKQVACWPCRNEKMQLPARINLSVIVPLTSHPWGRGGLGAWGVAEVDSLGESNRAQKYAGNGLGRA